VVGEGGPPLLGRATDQREAGGVIEAGERPPHQHRPAKHDDAVGETHEREPTAHSDDREGDESAGAESVREYAADRGADADEGVARADDGPDECRRRVELGHPHPDEKWYG